MGQQLTPQQHRRVDQVESLIGLMAPALNLVLAAGERLSRLVEPEDTEYYPPRTAPDQPAAGESERTES